MDILLPLFGISSSINQKNITENNKKKFNNKHNNIKNSSIQPIYSSNNLIKNINLIWDTTEKQFDKSFNENSLVINNIYRDMKQNDDFNKPKTNKSRSINKNQLEFFESISDNDIKTDNINLFNSKNKINLNTLIDPLDLATNSIEKPKIKVYENKKNNLINSNYNIDDIYLDIIDENRGGNMLDYQFSSLKFDNPTNPIGNPSKKNNQNIIKNAQFSNIRNKNTYGVIPDEMMTHNNMVPYFKGKGMMGNDSTNQEQMSNQFQRKLELFSGSLDNLQYKPKTERRPLFNPMIGLTNVYGSSVKTDEFEGRFIPGRERRNEKPFQEIKVTPGLNLSYNTVGRQGFHDPFRALPKTTNEIRTKNNPKLTYNNPMGGIVTDNVIESSNINTFQRYGGGSRPIDPVVAKRHPDRFEEYGNKRHIPTKGFYDKPMQVGKYDRRTIGTANRGIKETNKTGPLSQLTQGNVVNGQVKSNKENFIHDGPRNLGIMETLKTYAADYFNLTPEPTQRNTYNSEDKGNVGSNQYNQNYIFDQKNNIQDPTQRNTYNINDKGNVGSNQYNQNYLFDQKNNIQDPTQRNTYNINDKGNIGSNQYNQNYLFDQKNNIQDPTQRNTYNVNDKGNIGSDQYNQNYLFDQKNNIQDPTQRNTYNINDKGNVGSNQYNQNYIFDQKNNIQDPTQRNTYNVNDKGNVGSNQNNKIYIYNKDLMTPDPTMRNIHNVNDSMGAPKDHNKPRVREDIENMTTNISKDMMTIVPHGPTYSNYEKGPSMEGTMFRSCNKIQINRDLYPDIKQELNPGLQWPNTQSKQKVINWNESKIQPRFDDMPRANFQGNPYINDTQNTSIYPQFYFNNSTIGSNDNSPNYQFY